MNTYQDENILSPVVVYMYMGCPLSAPLQLLPRPVDYPVGQKPTEGSFDEPPVGALLGVLVLGRADGGRAEGRRGHPDALCADPLAGLIPDPNGLDGRGIERCAGRVLHPRAGVGIAEAPGHGLVDHVLAVARAVVAASPG
jgi:hypothetical protein